MDERKEYHNQTNDYYLNQFFSDDGNDNNVEIFGGMNNLFLCPLIIIH